MGSDFSNAAPGIMDGLKHMGSQLNHLMDENPTATKWISFGLAMLAGLTWGGSLVHGLLANIAPGLANNSLISGIVTALVWVGAFIGANKLSDYLANKGAGTRADERTAAGQERDRNMAAFNAAGGDPSGSRFSNDTRTNPNLFAANGGRMNPADMPIGQTFSNAAGPQGGRYQPMMPRGRFMEDSPNFMYRYPVPVR